MNKPFYLPKKSLTGRMEHSKPTIQILPTPASVEKSMWEHELDKIRDLSKQSALSGKTFMVARQAPLRPGDLVVWEPTGAPGLWLITDIHHPYKGVGADVDFRSIEKSLADLSPEAQKVFEKKYKLPRKRNSIRRGHVRLEWFAGWAGYAGNGLPVSVKIKTVRRPNEMEALAIAAL
jgi:hypothetical protein